jgi:Flp pilus assembly protein TadG
MAVFVALLFQVLFVFFAMIINVGLLVHDKINLQNSVDLAAIYAAQKQAEVLNAIAHTNYQIRQSWKLLAWRIYVEGDLGRDNHLVKRLRQNDFPEALDTNLVMPSVCVAHSDWSDTMKNTGNACKDAKIRIPTIPKVKVVFPNPTNQMIDEFLERQKKIFQESSIRLI